MISNFAFSHHFFFGLPVLEARIQQLQSDVVLDVQHAKVQFVKVPSYGRGALSGRAQRGSAHEKSDIPKSGQTVAKGAYKPQPSRWMEKLSQEKKNKLKKQQHLQQKMETTIKEKPSAKSKGSLLPTGTTLKTVSPAVKKIKGDTKLSEEIRAAVSSAATAAVLTGGKAAVSHKASKQKQKDSKNKVVDKEAKEQTSTCSQGRNEELGEVGELEKRLNEQVSQWTSTSTTERLQEGKEGSACGDIQLNIRSYLDACIFVGDIDRAHRFLLSQHRVRSRRKLLTTGVYNIMMRVWAKKVSPKIVS